MPPTDLGSTACRCVLEVCSLPHSASGSCSTAGPGSTLVFATVSVLQGFQHSISSHLESSFYSIHYVAVNSKLPGQVFSAFSKCGVWWQARLGAMASSTPSELDRMSLCCACILSGIKTRAAALEQLMSAEEMCTHCAKRMM